MSRSEDMEAYVMGMALTNGHGYGPRRSMMFCDYCGESIGYQLVCPVCGGEFCPNEGCLMPAGAGVPCLACEKGSPCDVPED